MSYPIPLVVNDVRPRFYEEDRKKLYRELFMQMPKQLDMYFSINNLVSALTKPPKILIPNLEHHMLTSNGATGCLSVDCQVHSAEENSRVSISLIVAIIAINLSSHSSQDNESLINRYIPAETTDASINHINYAINIITSRTIDDYYKGYLKLFKLNSLTDTPEHKKEAINILFDFTLRILNMAPPNIVLQQNNSLLDYEKFYTILAKYFEITIHLFVKDTMQVILGGNNVILKIIITSEPHYHHFLITNSQYGTELKPLIQEEYDTKGSKLLEYSKEYLTGGTYSKFIESAAQLKYSTSSIKYKKMHNRDKFVLPVTEGQQDIDFAMLYIPSQKEKEQCQEIY